MKDNRSNCTSPAPVVKFDIERVVRRSMYKLSDDERSEKSQQMGNIFSLSCKFFLFSCFIYLIIVVVVLCTGISQRVTILSLAKENVNPPLTKISSKNCFFCGLWRSSHIASCRWRRQEFLFFLFGRLHNLCCLLFCVKSIKASVQTLVYGYSSSRTRWPATPPP